MKEDRINVAIEIGDRRVTLEGPRDFVESEVRRLTAAIAAPLETAAKVPENRAEDLSPKGQTERDFITMKAPSGHQETVAALAFYLTEQGQEEFTDEDIRRAYIRAGVRPPKVVAQALRDAKNNKDYIERGSSRGTYRLSHHGDRFVRFDLPK